MIFIFKEIDNLTYKSGKGISTDFTTFSLLSKKKKATSKVLPLFCVQKETSFLVHNTLPFTSLLCMSFHMPAAHWQTPGSGPIALTLQTNAVSLGDKDANYWDSGSSQHSQPTIHLSPTSQAEWTHLLDLENKAMFPLSKPLTWHISVTLTQGAAACPGSRDGEKRSQKRWERAEGVAFYSHIIYKL